MFDSFRIELHVDVSIASCFSVLLNSKNVLPYEMTKGMSRSPLFVLYGLFYSIEYMLCVVF